MLRIGLCVVSLVLCSHAALADVYKCPDGKGGARYQNIPCVGETAPVFESVPASEPSHLPPPPSPEASEEPSPPAGYVSPPPPPLAPPPQITSETPAQPVDTRQFGTIQNGMSEAEVVKRLGEPARVIEEARTMRRGPGLASTTWVETHQYTYYYPGTRQTMATYITFVDGYVVGKRKVRE
jgi:hypothetical protein